MATYFCVYEHVPFLFIVGSLLYLDSKVSMWEWNWSCLSHNIYSLFNYLHLICDALKKTPPHRFSSLVDISSFRKGWNSATKFILCVTHVCGCGSTSFQELSKDSWNYTTTQLMGVQLLGKNRNIVIMNVPTYTVVYHMAGGMAIPVFEGEKWHPLDSCITPAAQEIHPPLSWPGSWNTDPILPSGTVAADDFH